MELCFGILLLIWWVLSLISQLNIKVRTFFGKNIFHLVPNFRFFAPVPIRKDYYLEYRLIKPSLRTTKWTRIEFFRERTLLSIIWYPEKRWRKTYNTYSKRIIRLLSSSNPKAAVKSISYLHLLTFLQNINSVSVKDSKGLQFRIVSKQAFGEKTNPRLILISDWHFPLKNSNA